MSVTSPEDTVSELETLRGTIFLSHAAADKGVVAPVERSLAAGSVFYDLRSIAPGENTIAAMKKGVEGAAVFVLFHSPETETVWVRFEQELAELAKIRNSDLQILVIPIRGATHATLPEWMQRFMTMPEVSNTSDVVRTIQYLYERSLTFQRPDQVDEYVGREALERDLSLAVRVTPAKTGKPLNVFILTGVQGIGRTSLAKRLTEHAFSGVRPAGPVFDLSTAADAVDWHLRFRQDLDGHLTPDEAAAQIDAFNALSAREQAATLVASLSHWAELNQVVTLSVRRGLRDRGQILRPWLDELFRLLASRPDIRLIIVSERRLAETSLRGIDNVRQVHLEELDNEVVQYILTKRIDERFMQISSLAAISKNIHGHPATATYVANLVNAGRSLDSLLLLPDPIYEFQDSVMKGMFEGDGIISDLQKRILYLLCHFPKLSAGIIHQTFPNSPKDELVTSLWELVDFSLADQAERGVYKVPSVVASAFRRHADGSYGEIFERVADLLKDQFSRGELDFGLIESLVIGAVERDQGIPSELIKVLTPSNLLPVVESEYFQGVRSEGEERQGHFNNATLIAKLALTMPGSDDTLEEILFFGADAQVRMGKFPEEFVSVMRTKAYSTADYIEGSYLYHNQRDYDGAIKKLKASLASSNFRLRKTRLLTRIFLRKGEYRDALDVLERVHDARLLSDVGLAVMKVKALRGARLYPEANQLEQKLKLQADARGELSLYYAGSALKEGKLEDALRHVQAAESKDANKVTIRILKCAVEVERGNNENLVETCSLARAANREADAWQLQARAAVVAKDWKSALEFLGNIDKKDFFDLNIELRAIDLKLADAAVQRDPAALAIAGDRRTEVLKLLSHTTDRIGL